MKTQCPSNCTASPGHHFITLLLLLLGLLPADSARADAWTETKKTLYVIRADFPDLIGEAIPQAELTTRINLTVSNQLYQMSYGKTWVEATISPMVVRLPGNTNSYAPNNWDVLHSDAVAAFNAQNTGINLSNYNVVAVAIKYIGLSSPGRVASPFTFPFWRMWLSQTLRPGVIGGGLSAEVITHEMGHIYGLPHANAWIGPLVGGNAENAGDIFDIMGTGYLQLSQAHFNPWAKSRLNWLTATQWTDVTASGNYRIYRFDHHATTASTSRGLRIPKAAPNDYYWVGYRRAFTNNASLSNGAYLLWGTPAQSLLIDTTPNSSMDPYQDRLDSALAISQTYLDPAANIQITPLGNGGTAPDEWLDVNVQFGALPMIRLASSAVAAEGCLPANGVVDPGETVTLNLTLTNLAAAPTTNLIATLLATNGVVSPSAPQSYAAVLGGTAVTRAFTFMATGQCGGTITVMLQLQDGPSSLGTVSTTLTLGATEAIISQNFDSVTAPALPASWTVSWTGAGAAWATTVAAASSAPNSAFATNPAAVSDNRLSSPSLGIATTSARLTFRHSYDTERDYDGGVLEIAIGGGAFTDILAAGGSFVTNGYTGILTGVGAGNPLAGRSAWHGASGGFITTTVNLPSAAAGQTIQLRWRFGTDPSVAAVGWFVDDISVSGGSSCCTGSGGLPPTVTTLAPTSLTTNAATLNGSANPNGSAAIGYFQWGTNTSYGQTTVATTLGSGSSAVDFSRTLSGLVAGRTYHFRAAASNSAGIVYGANMTFTTPTPPTAPTVTTLAATAVTTNGATLNGSGNPNGSAAVGFFQWGTNTSYGQTTASTTLGSGSSAVDFSRTLSGLVAGRTYHFRAAASNAAGVVYGANMTFTTPTPPAAATVTTLAATAVTTNGATLNGSGNPNGSAAIGFFQWGTNTSYGQTTTSTSLGSGSSAVAFSRALTGLVPGRTYHFRAAGSNSAGIVYGANMTFTTPTPPTAPTVTTLAATAVTTNAATLNGSANPNGSAAIGFFQWGTNTSYGQTTTSTALGSGSSAVAFSRALSGLVPGRTYHFRAAASNSVGIVYGANMTFTTPLELQPFTNVPIAGLQGVFDSAMAWGDYDSDGRLDFLITGNSSLQHLTELWRNTGSGFSNVPVAGLRGVSQGSVAWSDYNHDGRLDFFITGNAGETNLSQLWRNTGSGFATVPMPGLPQLHYASVAWGDYDNDGRPDFLLAGNTGSPNAGSTNLSQLWRNTGSGFTRVPIPGLPNVSLGAVAWADYNKDGRLDFLITGYTGSNSISQLWRNTGSGFANVPIAGLTGVYSSSVAWADYNNDGRLDLLITGQSTNLGIAQLWQNTGAGFVNVPIAGLPGIVDGGAAWGDYNNDGRLDLLLSGSGFSQLWRNTGTGFTHVPIPGLAGDWFGSVAWGDFGNDGRLDFFLTGYSTGLWQNNEPASNTPPSAPTGLLAQVQPNSVTLNWLPASDDHTPSSGLSYNLILATASNSVNLASPMANPTNGYRRVVQLGGANLRTSWTFTNLPPAPIYYWSVQAVDTSFAGGPFAAVQSVLNVVFTGMTEPSSGQATIAFMGTSGHLYTVERSADLVMWTVAGTATESPAGSGNFIFVDTSASASARYYRIRY